MTNSNNIVRACELFDRLCEEMMYGFNMKCELVHLIQHDPELVRRLEAFLDLCETQRSK